MNCTKKIIIMPKNPTATLEIPIMYLLSYFSLMNPDIGENTILKILEAATATENMSADPVSLKTSSTKINSELDYS
ncbi:hypothetical protein HV446_11835 [Enterococcus faecium]|nr:hypothetical protein [Enterococcus faecium]